MLPGWCARLTLEDGSVLEGTIRSITPDSIIVDHDSGSETHPLSGIRSISQLTPREKPILLAAAPLPDISVESGSTEIEKSAFNSLLRLKTRMRDRFELEKRKLIDSFAHEKTFLEENLKILATRHAALNERFEKARAEISTLKIQLEEKDARIKKFETEILNLKKELDYVSEMRLKGEVASAEKLQNALLRNKRLLDKEKQSLIATFEDQISEFERQLNEANLKILELSNQKSDLSARLANAEKLADQNGAALKARENELERYRKNTEERIERIRTEKDQDRVALEKMLNQSAENILELKNRVKMLEEENAYLKDRKALLEKKLEDSAGEIDSLTAERERQEQKLLEAVKKQQDLREQIREEQEKVLETLVQSVMMEHGPGGTGGDASPEGALREKAEEALLRARVAGKEEVMAGRSALFEIFKQDLSRTQQRLEETRQELERLRRENTELRLNVKRSDFQKRELERRKKEAQEQARQFQEEKKEIKTNVEQILDEIRRETEEKLEQDKKSLRNEFHQAIDTMESRFSGMEMDMELDEPAADLDYLSEPAASPDTAGEKASTSPVPGEAFPARDTESSSAPMTLDVGTVSQVEPEFSRIFIDTREKVREGDKVYVSTEQGEVEFSIIRIYEALNGAIAEIKEPAQIRHVEINDRVYVR
jgi:chromosome segregation ATPase